MSDLDDLLRKGNGKKHWNQVADWVLANQSLDQLIDYFLNSDDTQLIQRASGVFMSLVDRDKNLFYPYQEQLVQKLHDPNILMSQQRNIYRLFQFMYIREEIEGELLDACFKTLENPNLAIAVRVFAMTVAYKIGERFPEVFPEIKAMIELNRQMNPSPGFMNRSRKILKQISSKGY